MIVLGAVKLTKNVDMVVMVLDLMHFHELFCQLVKLIKMLLFFVQILVHKDKLIPKESISKFLVKIKQMD